MRVLVGQVIDGEVFSEHEESSTEDKEDPSAVSKTKAAVSALASAASSVVVSAVANTASAVKNAMSGTREALASERRPQSISLTVQRPSALQLAVQECRLECVSALVKAVCGDDHCADWSAQPSAIAAVDLAFSLALEAEPDAGAPRRGR